MKTAKSVFPIQWTKFFCIVAGIYAVIVAVYIFIETGKPLGSRDFHQFWYAGHFVIQGRDPYEAYFAREQPELPVQYLDGFTVNEYPVAQGDLTIIPSNTPLMLLVLTPFSFFSWGVAKWIFLFINFILMFVTGWLVLRRIPFGGVKLSALDEVLIFLVYFDLSATRIAIENGQTTMFVFLLMLLAILYAERSWKMAGTALGIALSKYSLSLPIFLFFLYKRNFKILLLAITVQILGLLGLAAIVRSSPALLVMENFRLFFELFDQPGIHLARFVGIFTDNPILTEIPVFIMTLLVFIPLFLWTRGRASGENAVLDFHVLTILFAWTMLVAYHRMYDTLILIFFVVLAFKGLSDPSLWKLGKWGRMALLAFLAIAPLIWILPARIVDKLLPEYYGTISDAVSTIFFLVMLVISMLLLRRYLHNIQTETTHRRTESREVRNDVQRDTQPRWANNH